MPDLPEPLVPPECDLNAFPDVPIEANRLRRSASWRAARRKPELGFYMMNLWLASWHEVPAGSLEDDDDALSDLAMCDPKRWPKVKHEVMRGWVKCSDGRLYHPVVAEKALGALKHKRSQSLRGAAGAAARWGKRSETNAQAMLAPLPEQCPSNATPMLPNGNDRIERIERNDSNETRASASAEDGFAEFWDAYPHKVGEGAAEPAYREALRYTDRVTLVAAAKRYEATKPADRQWCNPVKWLTEKRWLDEPADALAPKPNGQPPPTNLSDEEAQWSARLRGWAGKGFWLPQWGPKPGEEGCFAPRELVEKAFNERGHHAAQ